MSALRFHDLPVKRVSPEAAGAVAITFEVPEAQREAFGFELKTPWNQLSDSQRDVLLNGSRTVVFRS